MYSDGLGQWNSPEGLHCSALQLFDLLISCPPSFIFHQLAQSANVHIWQNLFRWDQQKQGRSWKQLMKLWDLHFTLIFLPPNLLILDADTRRITEINSNAGLPVEKRLGDLSWERGRIRGLLQVKLSTNLEYPFGRSYSWFKSLGAIWLSPLDHICTGV